jgi:heterodisulfide reductase subunit D
MTQENPDSSNSTQEAQAAAAEEQTAQQPEHKQDKEQQPQAEQQDSEARLLPIENLESRLLRQLDACTLCGECLKWCPVYEQEKREDVVPRDKILRFMRIIKSQHGIIASLLRSRVKNKALAAFISRIFRIRGITDQEIHSFAYSLYECSTCGQCAVVCPAGIDTVNLWENIRQLLVQAGYGPLDNHKVLTKSVKSYDNPWQQPRQGRTKWARSAKKKGLIKDNPRDIKKIPGSVLLFLGCTAVYNSYVQQVAINTVNILEALDIDYGCLGGAEKCCGSVLLRVGDPEYYRLAQENINEFHKLGIKTLITSCAGCFKTIKQDYPRVDDLQFEVLHTVEYLKRLVDQGILKFPHRVERKVTYHDPCHLGRATGVFEAPRQIMHSIPGLELIEMERIKEFSRCCGAGGGVKAGFPEVQEKISLARIREAESTGAEELISACPFCFAGLQVGIKALNSHLVMKDVTSLVAEALLGQELQPPSSGEQAQDKPRQKTAGKAASKAAQ